MQFLSYLQAGRWLKSVGLVQGSAAVWRSSAFIAYNRVCDALVVTSWTCYATL